MDALSIIIVCVVVLLLAVFSWLVVRYFTDPYSSSKLTSSVAASSLFFSLLCVLLIPIDIYLVSSEVDADTGFQLNPEQTASRMQTMKYIYFVFYGFQLAFFFFFLPLAYFYFEEDSQDSSTGARLFNAMKYTSVFTITMVVLLIIGVFINQNALDSDNGDNSFLDRLKDTVTAGDIILTFAVAFLTIFGLIGFITYTAFGLAYLPMNIMRSAPTARDVVDPRGLEHSLRVNSQTIDFLSKTDRRSAQQLTELQGAMREQKRLEKLREDADKPTPWSTRIWNGSAPLRIVVGILLLLVSLLFVVSILLSIIDAFVNSPCGAGCGYAVDERKIVNPINELLRLSSEVFPLDYIVYGAIVLYVFLCTISGIGRLGVRILWIKLYSLRKRRSMQNGLLMAIWMAALVMVALNLEVLTLAPEYSAFGTQRFLPPPQATPNGTASLLANGGSYSDVATIGVLQTADTELQECTLADASADHCVITQVYRLLGSTLSGFAFFGVVFTYANLAMIGIFFLSILYLMFCFKGDDYVMFDEEDGPDRLEAEFLN